MRGGFRAALAVARGIGGVAHDDRPEGRKHWGHHTETVYPADCVLCKALRSAPDKQGRGLLMMMFDAQCISLHHMGVVMSEVIRTTVPVTVEVHQAFKRLADAQGISLGRAMSIG